jgi:hypothetical protein
MLMKPIGLCLLVAVCAHAMMPLPVKMTPGTGRLAIDNSFQIAIAGVSDARLIAAAARATARLSRQTGIPFLGAGKPVLRIECAAAGNPMARW